MCKLLLYYIPRFYVFFPRVGVNVIWLNVLVLVLVDICY